MGACTITASPLSTCGGCGRPEFEVLEAGAAQHAGDPYQFKPELCGRYANIKGVRLERGFSKRILTELGDSCGGWNTCF